MAKLVQIIGVTHNPMLPRRFQKADGHPGMLKGREKFEEMRRKLAEARPDVLLVIANDHLNQWFMHNMPAFLVGKAPIAEGPFKDEEDFWGMPHYRAPANVEVAKTVVQAGFRFGVDFAFSDEFAIDHAFTVPLALIRPEADIPVVPIFANVMAPPLPPPSRFYQVGSALRDIIEELPMNVRVGVVASGHLSVEVGGPKMLPSIMGGGPPDSDFDARMVDLIGCGDVDGLLREATIERMLQAGNVTPAFMTFILAVGMARGKPASQAECVFSDTNTMPFLTWDLHREAA